MPSFKTQVLRNLTILVAYAVFNNVCISVFLGDYTNKHCKKQPIRVIRWRS